MMFRCFCVLLVGAAFSPLLRAEPKGWPVERGPSRELVPYAADRALIKKAPAELLSDYPAFYLHAATSFRIESDGTVECTTHEVIRLNNRKGIDQVGEHRNITYAPAYEKLTLNTARVLKAEGNTVEVGPEHLQLRDVHTDYFVYDSSKELIISFPALEVGDLVEVKWTTRGKNPEYAGHFFSRYHFGDEKMPIWDEAYAVRTEKGKSLKYSLINPHLFPDPKMHPDKDEKDGAATYIWRVGDRRPPVNEDHRPSKEELRPGVAISTFQSWKEVGDWERKTRAACEECTPELKKIVAKVKAENTTEEGIAEGLTHWMRTNIRYVSTGEKHDFTPHPPALVLKNRFGDCKDGVQLLSLLFKEAGIPCGFVSVSPRDDGQILPEVPCPWSTHALLWAKVDGKERWIDTTAPHAKWDYLPYSDRDRVCYIVNDKEIRLSRTPAMTAGDNKVVSITKIKLDDKGNARCERTVDYSGEAALMKREEWADVSAKERRRLIRNDLLDVQPKAKLGEKIDIDPQALDGSRDPLTVKYAYEVPQLLHGEEELEGSVVDHSLWSHLLSLTVDDEREQAIELKEPFESRQTFEVTAPKGFVLEDPPEEMELKSKWGKFSVKFTEEKKGRQWVIEFHTKIDRTRIEKAEFDEFREFQDEVQAAIHVPLVMREVRDN